MVDVNRQRQCNGAGSHHQIIHFVGGVKRLIQNVTFIWENEMVHIVDVNGVEYVVNKNNVLFYERLKIGEGKQNGHGNAGNGRSCKKG